MRIVLILILLVGVLVPSFGQIDKTIKKVTQVVTKDGLTSDDVAKGLKAALLKGVDTGTGQASQVDGFFKNPEIKIPFPEDAQNVASALKKIGMDKAVKNFVLTLNRSAEQAAGEAKPIFVAAIKEMTIDDAWSILNGQDKQGATNYLKKATSDELTKKFTPIIEAALSSTKATNYYADLITAYNKLPAVQKRNPDLTAYATQKTMDGLFTLIGKEELKIREDPAARTSDILVKVFN